MCERLKERKYNIVLIIDRKVERENKKEKDRQREREKL
jgi:hypothetical protein